MFPNGCPVTFPSLEINQWTEAGSGNTRTFTKSGHSITITQQSAPASGASGTFNLKFHGIEGRRAGCFTIRYLLLNNMGNL